MNANIIASKVRQRTIELERKYDMKSCSKCGVVLTDEAKAFIYKGYVLCDLCKPLQQTPGTSVSKQKEVLALGTPFEIAKIGFYFGIGFLFMLMILVFVSSLMYSLFLLSHR